MPEEADPYAGDGKVLEYKKFRPGVAAAKLERRDGSTFYRFRDWGETSDYGSQMYHSFADFVRLMADAP